MHFAVPSNLKPSSTIPRLFALVLALYEGIYEELASPSYSLYPLLAMKSLTSDTVSILSSKMKLASQPAALELGSTKSTHP